MKNSTEEDYRNSRKAHWNKQADRHQAQSWGGYYHRRLHEVYASQILPGQRVLEIGCGHGDLLAGLKPSRGVGIDFSEEMIAVATQRYPQHTFLLCDAHEITLDEQFDVIILSDLLNDLWDVQRVLEKLRDLSAPGTRIIINTYSRVWELPLLIAQKIGVARPMLKQNWLTVADIKGLAELVGLETIRSWAEIIFPFSIPLITSLCNKIIARTWPFHYLCLTNFLVARPVMKKSMDSPPLVSVIVAARNEEGHIKNLFERVPELGGGTEIIFVEGGSSDNTYGEIEKNMRDFPHRRCSLYRQTGTGKGDAVRLGFDKASGEVLMILDADLTVPP